MTCGFPPGHFSFCFFGNLFFCDDLRSLPRSCEVFLLYLLHTSWVKDLYRVLTAETSWRTQNFCIELFFFSRLSRVGFFKKFFSLFLEKHSLYFSASFLLFHLSWVMVFLQCTISRNQLKNPKFLRGAFLFSTLRVGFFFELFFSIFGEAFIIFLCFFSTFFTYRG